jgi:mycofactocin precursor
VRVPEAALHNLSPAESPAESLEYPAKPGEGVAEDDFGAEMSDEELGELLVREITIDGMCGVY